MSQPADAWNQIPDLMERGSVRQHVTARLRDDIVHGRLRPGARLTEASLGSRYFVSRTPVRDALRTLEEEGLVATAGARRYVARLGRRGTEELFDLRAALEHWRPIEIELRNYRRDGAPFWVELSIVPVSLAKACA